MVMFVSGYIVYSSYNILYGYFFFGGGFVILKVFIIFFIVYIYDVICGVCSCVWCCFKK